MRHRRANPLVQGHGGSKGHSCSAVRCAGTWLGIYGELVFKMGIFFPFSYFSTQESSGPPCPSLALTPHRQSPGNFSGSPPKMHAEPTRISRSMVAAHAHSPLTWYPGFGRNFLNGLLPPLFPSNTHTKRPVALPRRLTSSGGATPQATEFRSLRPPPSPGG